MRLIPFSVAMEVMPMSVAVDATEKAFKAQSTEGICSVPNRVHVPGPKDGESNLFMPGLVNDAAEPALGIKVVNIRPTNRERKMPFLQALYTDFDPVTGVVTACLDGGALTYLRTGASNGVAARYLAREDSHTLCVLGCGAQGKAGAEAIMAVRDITKVFCYDAFPGGADRYVAWLKETYPKVEGAAVATPDDGVSQSDIVLTCTPSKTALFSHSAVRPGTHISAVGAYTPDMCEIPPGTVAAAHLYVDCLQAIMVEGGDIIQPVKAGLITWDHVQGEIGALAKGECVGRTSAEQITMFKTVGTAVQDVVVGHEICRLAEEQGLGTEVPDLWNH